MIHFPVAFARVVVVTHSIAKNAGKRGHFLSRENANGNNVGKCIFFIRYCMIYYK